MNKQISIIVAIAKHNAIGRNNNLLCHVPGDLKRFKQITTGHAIIMGRKTYDSLPRKPLPGRANIVITHNRRFSAPGCSVVHSLNEALALCPKDQESFVIGGHAIFNMFLPYTNKLYITHIYQSFEADVFFPDIDFGRWSVTSEEKIQKHDDCYFDYSFTNYIRRN